LPETRGLGIGSAMMTKCLETAKDFGFKQCYLETMPFMLDAQSYTEKGFENINAPMGSTGHTSCRMLKNL
jgi:putative acetyltransferase